MNKYESVIIINPNIEENGIKSLIEKFSNIINSDGKVAEVQEPGKKKLAYDINKQKEGYYVVFTFEANPKLIAELERNYTITDEVMKFVVIRKDE